VRYARICPFCRKDRGKIRKLGAASFQGACPKCGATGPKRESHQEALRAWNGREVINQRPALSLGVVSEPFSDLFGSNIIVFLIKAAKLSALELLEFQLMALELVWLT
jgi:hypothetical protein